MAVPGSGEISLGKIRQELQAANYTSGPYTAASTSLDLAENGTYATINTCSPYYPLSANPANMSEWYGYDHDALCPFNQYALDDGGAGATNFLYDSADNYPGNVSTTMPDMFGNYVVNFWIKRHEASTVYQGLIAHLYTIPWGVGEENEIQWVVLWGSQYDNSVSGYKNFIELYHATNNAAQLWSVCNLSDSNNKNTTNISPNSYWDANNAGDVNGNGWCNISIHIDYSNWDTDDYIKYFYNGQQLDVPLDSTPNSYDSWHYSYSGEWVIGPNEGSATFSIAGSNVGAGPSGSEDTTDYIGTLLDEFVLADITPTDQMAIDFWNSGTPQHPTGSLGGGQKYLYYSFENGSQLGEETGDYGYNYDLVDYNSPTQTSDHA